MAVNVEPGLPYLANQKCCARLHARCGGTLLTAPPGADLSVPADKNRITLDEQELKHIDDLWHDVQSMIGRKNLGGSFNVALMPLNLEAGPNGSIYVQLRLRIRRRERHGTRAGQVQEKAYLQQPRAEKDLEVYDQEDGSGVDLDKVEVVATVRFDLNRPVGRTIVFCGSGCEAARFAQA